MCQCLGRFAMQRVTVPASVGASNIVRAVDMSFLLFSLTVRRTRLNCKDNNFLKIFDFTIRTQKPPFFGYFFPFGENYFLSRGRALAVLRGLIGCPCSWVLSRPAAARDGGRPWVFVRWILPLTGCFCPAGVGCPCFRSGSILVGLLPVACAAPFRSPVGHG